MDIEIKNLTKTYRQNKVIALNNISLKISTGIVGMLGDNGAGKSTLIKILVTLLSKTKGEIKIDNFTLPKDVESIRNILGYLPQDFDMFGTLTVYEAMYYVCSLKDVPINNRAQEIEHLLQKVNLIDKKDFKVNQLSGGMKQRLGIATSFIGDPKLIILDEPTVGLDPIERLNFRNLVSDFSKDRLIILSSHIISDISMLCDDIIIMKKGNLLYCGKTYDLVESLSGKIFIAPIQSEDTIDTKFFKNIISISRTEIRYFTDNNILLPNSTSSTPNLEDAYFYVSSKGGYYDDF
ncbi:hypothetical protein AN641_04345 [Candidatus Epulonipiscioides gigas]|nr:hypothetical protein AN641_04345 [Epulopiscium sp. SCG-C07WGA-EpuloA2]